MATKKPKKWIVALRAVKAAERALADARRDLRKADARERYALAETMIRAAGIALCTRNTEGLRIFAKPSDEFLSRTPRGFVVSPRTKKEDLVAFFERRIEAVAANHARAILTIEEPDVAAEIPLFEGRAVVIRSRRAAADELRAIVASHLARGGYAFPGAGTLAEQLAVLVMGFAVNDESEIGKTVRARMPAPKSARWKSHWQKTAPVVAQKIVERTMRNTTTPDPEAVVRVALAELGYRGRKNASLYEATLARMKYDAIKKKPRVVH